MPMQNTRSKKSPAKKNNANTANSKNTTGKTDKSSKSIRLAPKYNGNVSKNAAGISAAAVSSAGEIRKAPARRRKIRWVRSGFDYPLFTIVIILMAYGLIMLFSASYVDGYRSHNDSLYYIKRQLMFAAVGIVVMLMLSSLNYRLFKAKYMLRAIVIVAAALMILVKVIGTTQGGAERWLKIGEITFQPSELLKIAVIIVFADLTEKLGDGIRDFRKGFLPFTIVLGVSCLLLLIQPHLSGTIIVFTIGFLMMLVAGVRTRHLVCLAVMCGLLLAVGIPLLKAVGYDYFGDRITSWLAPESDIQGITFQTYQSLVTIGSGGMFGLGLGNSREKYGYLPASQNDFLFSIICEELGFVGAMLVILLFVILVIRGFYIASHARDKFGMMLAFGITLQIGLQALLNIAVATNAIPNTGISLPFFSYGGTALMVQLAEMGILLSISRKAALE